MINVKDIKIYLNESEDLLLDKICKNLRCKRSDILSYQIDRKSLDARTIPYFNYSVDLEIKNQEKYLQLKNVSLTKTVSLQLEKVNCDIKPIIVGYGPSGIFAALGLLRQGIKSVVFEKGSRVNKRSKDVYNFFKTGELNPESNVQFGEGGAGTFSDAKLTSRSKDPNISYISEVFVEFGAKKEILYEHLPHIGTDRIRKIVTNITDYLIENGVEFHFDESVENLIIENSKVKGVITQKQEYYSDIVVLALGHSSFNLIENISKLGVMMEPKEFSVGVRVEHPRELIDRNQNGEYYKQLESASYKLIHKIDSKYSTYSFCMCPGGHIVSSNSEKGAICLNGMSYAMRNNEYSNSGILVPVRLEDLKSDELLAGIKYIKNLEKKAYDISGSYKAPAQNIKDFINDDLNPLIFESTYPNGTILYDLNNFFDDKIVKCLKEGFINFEKKIPGFIEKGIVLAPETRSSCAVRIKRKLDYQSENIENLYPIGEGAGYSGGIMSSSLDGLKCSMKIAERFK